MAITAADIQNQSFSIDRKGYDVDEVDVFLEHVADEIDAMNKQIADLEQQLADERMAGLDKPADLDEDADDDKDATQYFPPISNFDDEDDEEEAPVEEAPAAPKAPAAPEPSPAAAERIASLENKVKQLEAQLAEKSANDNAISQALIVAQRSADDIVAKAKDDANTIVKDADAEADRIRSKAESDRKKVQDSIRDLEDEREKVRINYRDMLNDFVDDAERKLSSIDASYKKSSHAAHGSLSTATAAMPATAAKAEPKVRETAANYQVPVQPLANNDKQVNVPKVKSFTEKDFSGYGDADDDFDFDDPD